MRKGAVLVHSDLEHPSKVVGVKQVRRALANGTAQRLYLARDADPHLTQALEEQAGQQGVETVWANSMRELGRDCGIAVGASAAAELNGPS